MTGKPVPLGAIFHFSSRRRREIKVDESLRKAVLAATHAVREMLANRRLPPPVNDARCRQCSLINPCQPKAITAKARYSTLLAELLSVS